MKTGGKKLTGFGVVLILFLMGIFSKGSDDYSGIVALRERNAASRQEIIKNADSQISYEKICTTRMILGNQQSFLQDVRMASMQVFHGIANIFRKDNYMPYLMFYYLNISIILWKILDTMPEILRYIHNQDGEKVRFSRYIL